MEWFISIWRLIDIVRTAYDYGDESDSFHDMIIYAA
jgi:hypothetical protein